MGVRSSDLKAVLTSPRHYNLREKFSPTPAMLKGLMVHCLALQPETFDDNFVTVNVGSRSAKAYKDAARDAGEDVHVVLGKEKDDASLVACMLMGHDHARRYLHDLPGTCEQTWTWADPITKQACKARTDRVATDEDGTPVIVELKTTSSLDMRSWQNDFVKYSYHLQLAHYQDGVTEVLGTVPRVVVVAVETSAPYDVGVFTLGDGELSVGRDLAQEAMKTLTACKEANEFPGRYPDVEPLYLPTWAYGDEA